MERHGPLRRIPARLPRLVLPVLRSPIRRPLRTDPRATYRRLGAFAPVHLSLAPAHRRGCWGSLYAALLRRARIDDEAPLRELLAQSSLLPAKVTASPPRLYAVDVSVWSRCDAEASPARGYYYHPSRHSAGQPIVTGWAYLFVARLSPSSATHGWRLSTRGGSVPKRTP